MGIPCKKYYKLNENKIIECLKMAKLPVSNEVMNKEEKPRYQQYQHLIQYKMKIWCS